jgi:hypothetical protein
MSLSGPILPRSMAYERVHMPVVAASKVLDLRERGGFPRSIPIVANASRVILHPTGD